MPYNQASNGDANLLTIPRACVDVALLDSLDKPIGGWRHLGDVSAASVQFAFEEAEHFTSCGEQRTRNARVAVEVTADLSMTLDAGLDTKNLELIFSGSSDTRLQDDTVSNPNSSQYTLDLPTQDAVEQGILIIPNPYYTGSDKHQDSAPWARRYQLWINGGRIYGGGPPTGLTFEEPAATVVSAPSYNVTDNLYKIESAAQFVIHDIAQTVFGTPTTTEIGKAIAHATKIIDGYSLDLLYGTLDFNFAQAGSGAADTRTLQAAIANIGPIAATSKYLKFPITLADAAVPLSATHAHIDRTRALTRTSRPIAIRLRQQDTNRAGFRAVTHIHKVRLIPNGQFDMISDGTEFSTMTLEGSLELPSWADATVPGREGWMTREELKSST
jgi:hypothetical protein